MMQAFFVGIFVEVSKNNLSYKEVKPLLNLVILNKSISIMSPILAVLGTVKWIFKGATSRYFESFL